MTSADRKKHGVKRGETVGIYTVTDPAGFCGLLPTAVINPGNANAGITVILTTADRRILTGVPA